MKITLKQPSKIIYERTTHQIVVDIDGVEYQIRQSEDDNGCEYWVYSESLNNGHTLEVFQMEDGELKDVIERLAEYTHDDYTFSDDMVGKEIDLNNFDEDWA